MPPKVKVSKEDIINATVDIVRKFGEQTINARTIASVLNCSTQPIFSNFSSMEELQNAVVEKAKEIYDKYIQNEIERNIYPEYKASGMAYIRFAKDERQLFKILFMCDRTNDKSSESIEFGNKIEKIVYSSTGLDANNAKLFHLEMWAYVHGIATMIATGFADLEWELVSRMLTDAYKGMRKQYGLE